jgi:hypothetical protein
MPRNAAWWTCAQRETLIIAGFALDGNKWDERHKGDDLLYAGKVDHGFDKASAADLQKRLKLLIRKTQPYASPTRVSGSTEASGGDRVSRQIGERKDSPSLLSRPPGGPVMDAFDRFWQWADKPPESLVTIPAELHTAVMEPAPEDRRDRAKVDHAASRFEESER